MTRRVRLAFDLETSASEDELASLLKLTERCCVVLQTIAAGPPISASITSAS